jgi:hypothetical protein
MARSAAIVAALCLLFGGNAQADVLSTAMEIMSKHVEFKHSPDLLAGKGIPTTVTIGDGVLEGRENNETHQRHFLGLPFAAPPVDDLRWKAPQKEAGWDGVFDASKFGNSCMQV